MGHATHFLSRLERLAMPEVELALSLYRNTALLKAVLDLSQVPEGAERVAIALAPGSGSPHLVVTRAGDFVTCLGATMTVGSMPVISRGRLDAVATRVSALRERLALAERLTGPGARTRRLLGRLCDAGHALSREEFLGLSAFTPMMLPHYVIWLEKVDEPLTFMREKAAWSTERVDLRRPDLVSKDNLLRYWRAVWAVGHVSALCSEYVRELYDDVHAAGGTRMRPLNGTGTRAGMVATSVRAATIPAQAGKIALPTYKEVFRGAQWPEDMLTGAVGLVTTAVRHASLRSEILKVLAHRFTPDPQRWGPWTERHVPLQRYFARLIEDPDGAVAHAAGTGRGLWMGWSQGLRPGSSWRFERPEDVPESLALAAACSDSGQIDHPDAMVNFVQLLPFAARARPEEIYLPQACLSELEESRGEAWAVERANQLLADFRVLFRKRTPVRAAEPRPGPNAPCPCGSGKKFKRCCAGARPAGRAVG